MRNDQQAFTVFGGSFVHENHDHEPATLSRRSALPVAAVFAALILGTVTAGATTQHIRAMGAGFMHSGVFGTPSLQVAVY